jgi:hypothetical protein
VKARVEVQRLPRHPNRSIPIISLYNMELFIDNVPLLFNTSDRRINSQALYRSVNHSTDISDHLKLKYLNEKEIEIIEINSALACIITQFNSAISLYN